MAGYEIPKNRLLPPVPSPPPSYQYYDYLYTFSLSDQFSRLNAKKCGICGLVLISSFVCFVLYLVGFGMTPNHQLECSMSYTYFEETGFCYKLTIPEVVFQEAEQSCLSEGANLVSIHSATENELLKKLYTTKFNEYLNEVDRHKEKSHVWIGMVHRNGRWLWKDGTPMDYQNWVIRSSYVLGEEKWAEMVVSKQDGFSPKGNEWINAYPFQKRSYICKKASNSEKGNSSPMPTLSPYTGFYATTVPSRSHRATCSFGYAYFQGTGYCYKGYAQSVTFPEARRICEQDNAQLASIHSDEENDFAIRVARSAFKHPEATFGYKHRLWIGLVYSENSKKWTWLDGSPVDYVNWMPQEPNLLHYEHWAQIVIESFRSINPWGKKWMNQDQNSDDYFLCKKLPDKY